MADALGNVKSGRRRGRIWLNFLIISLRAGQSAHRVLFHQKIP
jgi:hypothetical protein